MNIINKIPVYLIAIIYLVFGSNYFLHFIPAPPMEGNAGSFIGLLATTGFLSVVKIMEILFAIFLIIPRTKSLSLLLIAPISLNILLFELLISHQPGIGILLVLLNGIAIFQNKEKYTGIIQAV